MDDAEAAATISGPPTSHGLQATGHKPSRHHLPRSSNH